MNTLLVFLLGMGTTVIINKLIASYMKVAIQVEQRTILIEHIKLRRLTSEYNALLDEKILEMKR